MLPSVPLDDLDPNDHIAPAVGMTCPPKHPAACRRFDRAQVLYVATGTMWLDTAEGTWTVPTRRAALIPPNVGHQVRLGGVSASSRLYIEPAAAPWFPNRCQVVNVSPLLRSLLLAAMHLPTEHQPGGRDATLIELILYEIQSENPLPLHLPMPRRVDLRSICQNFVRAPSIRPMPGEWADALHISKRTFNRMFRAETGLTFQQWRQRACILHAIRLLSDGVTVAQAATTLGYNTPAAFSAMFTQQVGSTPKSFQH